MAWKRADNGIMAEINIVPLTDIMLVLLVIFMVTTPMIVFESLKISLPAAKEGVTREKGKGTVISVTDEGKVYIDKQQINIDEVKKVLKDKLANNQNKTVLIKGDKSVNYGLIVKILDFAKASGAEKLSVATVKGQ